MSYRICILLSLASNFVLNNGLDKLIVELFRSSEIDQGIEKYIESSGLNFHESKYLVPCAISHNYYKELDAHPYFKSDFISCTLEISQEESAKIMDVYDYTLRLHFKSMEDLSLEYNKLNDKLVELIKRKELYDQPDQYIFYLEDEIDLPSLSVGYNNEDLLLYINYQTTSKLEFVKKLKSMEK